MKFNSNILKRARKIVAVFLLLNFVTASILFAFPAGQCNGMCGMEKVEQNCSFMITGEMSDNCCDMMSADEMNDNDFQSCEIEFTNLGCGLDNIPGSNNYYIVPVKYNEKVSFNIIANINIVQDKPFITYSSTAHFYITQKSPPVYLVVSSLLI